MGFQDPERSTWRCNDTAALSGAPPSERQPPLRPDVDAGEDDQSTRKIGRALPESGEPGGALGNMTYAEHRRNADQDERNGEPDREAQHQHYAERKFPELQAYEQDGDG